ncbi:MAG: amidohydrolase family protein [Haloechinothrix sp.]
MGIVDAHCHASLAWYEPVEALLHHMAAHGVNRAVLVQIHGHYDNAYLMDCVRRHPDRLAPVVLVDPTSPTAERDLETLAGRGIAGVRLNAGDRSPGRDPLALWRAAQRLDLPVSCSGRSAEFASPDFRQLVAALPRLRIVLEHLAGANYPNEQDTVERRRRAFDLASWPHVYVKVHGLGEFATRARPQSEPFPFARPLPPVLEMACAAFGPARMMWGSDFPPVSAREGYANALHLTMGALDQLSPAERSRIFEGTATELYLAAARRRGPSSEGRAS